MNTSRKNFTVADLMLLRECLMQDLALEYQTFIMFVPKANSGMSRSAKNIWRRMQDKTRWLNNVQAQIINRRSAKH